MEEQKFIIRGDGGGSDEPTIEPNSLATSTTAKVLFLVSDGETGGLYDQVNPLKSVFLNNTPAMTDDGVVRPGILTPFEAFGTANQPIAQGYPSSSTTYPVGQKITKSIPQAWTAQTNDVDAIRVTVRFPVLMQVDGDDGDQHGTAVLFSLQRNINGGPWSTYKSVKVKDKTVSPADIDYLVPRSGPGLMGVRVVRDSPDNTDPNIQNEIVFQYATEIKNQPLAYPNRAYIGLTITTEAVGQNYPTVSFDYLGIKVKVPSNYNQAGTTIEEMYQGVWDGTFKAAKEVCDNPVWVLYDLLTDTRHGMGKYVKPADIDQYSFYDAAVYCDQRVPSEFPETQPQQRRFTFNYQFTERVRGWELISNVASTFCAQIFTAGNRIKLVQDRAMTGFSRLITNSNVEDGLFEYTDTGANTRITAATVNYNDPDQNMVSVPVYYEDTAEVNRIGLNVADVTKLGCTTRGEALRYAKYLVETGKTNLETVTFTVGAKQAGILPGWIIKVADEHYAQITNSARLVAKTPTSITLDQSITVSSGNTFDVVAGDGMSVETRTFTGGSGTTLNFSGGAITAPVGADIIVTGTYAPRLFKVISVRETAPLKWTVSALQYDPNKYSAIDNTPPGPSLLYQAPSAVPTAPVGLTFREGSRKIDNNVRFTLMASWNRPAEGQVQSYLMRWRRQDLPWVDVETSNLSYEFPEVTSGLYEVEVYARSPFGNISPAATASYNLVVNGVELSPLFPPTNLGEYATGGDIFNEENLTIKFTNPTTNTVDRGTLRDFEVRVINVGSGDVIRTEYVPAVEPGANQTYIYSFEKNTQDGGPRRNVRIEVRCRDANYRLSTEAARTFNNPPPPVPADLNVIGALQSVKITMTLPTVADFRGILVWQSDTPNFTPSATTLIYDGQDSYIALNGMLDSTTFYYRIAAYDSYSKNPAELNLSAEFAVTTVDSPGIPRVTSLPATGEEGDIVYNLTDKKLYTYKNGAWTPTVAAVELVGKIVDAQMEAISATKIQGQVKDTQIEALAAAKVTGKLVDAQIDTLAASKITGQVASTQIAAVEASKVTGQLVDSQVANIAATKVTGTLVDSQIGSIAAGKITGTITNAQIAALDAAKLTGNITATTIADNIVTTPKLAAGAVITEKIAAGAVTTSKLVVAGGVGAALNADPTMKDNTAWVADGGTNFVLVADTTVPAGSSVGRATGSATLRSDRFPIVSTKKYRISFYAKKQASTTGTLHVRVHGFTAADAGIGDSTGFPESRIYTLDGTSSLESIAVPSTWTRYVGVFTPTPAMTMGRLVIIANHQGTGVLDIGDVRIEEQVPGELIVDGAITTNKLIVTSQGNALNPDPHIEDPTNAWSVPVGIALATNTTAAGATGKNYFSAMGTNARDKKVFAAQAIAIDSTKTYRGSARLFLDSSVDSHIFISIDFYDANGSFIPATTVNPVWGGTHSGNIWDSRVVGLPSIPRGQFVDCGASFGAGTPRPIPTTARTAKIGIWFQWAGEGTGAGQQAAQNIRIERMSGGELIVDGAITANKITAGTITGNEIAGSTITGTKIAAGTITGDNIAGTTITGAKIVGGTITGGLIAADAITATHIQALAIGTTELAANAVTAAKIAAGTITATEIAGSTITGSKIAAGTITSGLIAADAIQATHIQAGAIGVGELAADAVTSEKIAAGAITATEIASGAVTAIKIAADTITGDKIAANAISSGEIAANAILAGHIKAAEISSSHIAAGTIVAGNIATNTITGDRIAGGTITGNKIAGQTITAGNIAASTITGTQIAGTTITGSHIASNTITASHIQASALTVQDGSITNAKIANAAVDTLKIQGQAVTIPRNIYEPAVKTNSGEIQATLLWIGSSGNPIVLMFGAHVYSSRHETLRMRVQYIPNNVGGWQTIFDIGGGSISNYLQGQGMEGGQILFQPSVHGTHPVRILVDSAGAAVWASRAYITSLEVKR